MGTPKSFSSVIASSDVFSYCTHNMCLLSLDGEQCILPYLIPSAISGTSPLTDLGHPGVVDSPPGNLYPRKSLVSSANIVVVHMTGKSLIKMTNRIGPSTLPSGMPLRIPAQVYNLPFTTTCCCLPERMFSI